MSASLKKDLAEIIDQIVVPKPVYKYDSSYGVKDVAIFRIVDKASLPDSCSDHILASIVSKRMSLQYVDNQVSVRTIGMADVESVILNDISDFIRFNLRTPNPRLTKLYRHYRNNCAVTEDLYTVWKYMKTYDRSDIRHEKNILAILKLLMERK